MSVQQFCLRWNNHQPNFISVFSSLLHNEALVDVTLAAEGKQLQAHKVVLSACSSYFQTLFTTNPCQHPIVILKDVHYNDLKTMVDFMYYGEVNVSQEQLPHILKTAEMLKIKGLAEMPESLTKSDNKSSDQTDQTNTGNGGDTLWGSNESQPQYLHHQTQQRKSPSPVAGMSPSARRKRLRKPSTERLTDEHGSIIEGHTGLKSSKESVDMDTGHQDVTHETIDDSSSHQVQQIIPMAMSGSPATPTNSDPSTSTTHISHHQQHTSVQWAVVDPTYPRFAISSCASNIGLSSNQPNNPNLEATSTSTSAVNSTLTSTGSGAATNNGAGNSGGGQQSHIQMQYSGGSPYSSQIISINPNNTVNHSNYPSTMSTSTSPHEGESATVNVQTVYSQGPTPNQSPGPQIASHGQANTSQHHASGSGDASSGTPAPQKRKRSVNPQGDENFVRALEAVRFGGIGFCKAARLYGVNNRTLWLEYKKRGYPISRPSIKNRKIELKLEPDMSPGPSTPPNEENTSMENYNNMSQSSINMSGTTSTETSTPLMCPPHAHSMGVMSFLDTRQVEFPSGIHPMNRQRYTDGTTVNVNSTAMNLQGLNFNSIEEY